MYRIDRLILTGTVALAIGAPAAWGAVPKGQELFLSNRCTTCHSIKALGIQKKAIAGEEETSDAASSKTKPPDLSGVGTEHSAEWMSKWLLKQETKNGKTHRKKFRGTDADLKTLSTWLATLKTDESGKPKKAAAKEEMKKSEASPASEGTAEGQKTEATATETAPKTETPATTETK